MPDHADAIVARLPQDVRRDWENLTHPAAAPPRFDPGQIVTLPVPVQRWLLRAIAPETPLATTVTMHQHGRIDIRGWRRYRAAEVIGAEGYIWACATRIAGLPVRGYDRLVGDRADMVYRLVDRVRVVDESGPDLVRSAAGRLIGELCWVPAAALDSKLTWTAADDDSARVRTSWSGTTLDAVFTFDPSGDIASVAMRRWASIDDEPYAWHDFGAQVHQTSTFGGFTIPSRVTVGYGYDGPDWPGCAFLELTVDEARFV